MILQSLTRSNWLTTLDALAGFTQLQMSEDAKEKMAFRSHWGLYQFKRMPFGYSVTIWILQIHSLSHPNNTGTSEKLPNEFQMRHLVCKSFPWLGNMLNHMIKPLPMFQPESNLSPPELSPLSLKAVRGWPLGLLFLLFLFIHGLFSSIFPPYGLFFFICISSLP